jgi:hypothetical protein
VLDNNNCWLYELYGSSVNTDGTWNAASAAVWDLQNYTQRPLTWTSADAAGLPIFSGLVRYDEAASGQIGHAIRFTLQHSTAAFVEPATQFPARSKTIFLPSPAHWIYNPPLTPPVRRPTAAIRGAPSWPT